MALTAAAMAVRLRASAAAMKRAAEIKAPATVS
jgi:hypothetical protein